MEYYVYEWIRLDTNEPFYVGKGKGRRWCVLKRENDRFNKIVNKIPVAVNILESNLCEKEAFEYEIYYINEYRNIGFDLVNICDGGKTHQHYMVKKMVTMEIIGVKIKSYI